MQQKSEQSELALSKLFIVASLSTKTYIVFIVSCKTEKSRKKDMHTTDLQPHLISSQIILVHTLTGNILT